MSGPGQRMDDDAITVVIRLRVSRDARNAVVCAEEETIVKRLATRAEIANYVNAAWQDYVARCDTARARLKSDRALAPVNTPSQEVVVKRLEELGYMRGHGVLMEKPGAAPGRHVHILVARDGHTENLRTIPGATF